MSVATSYAKALYATAAEGRTPAEVAQVCDRIEIQLEATYQAIESLPQARVALFGPVMTAKEKAQVVSALAEKGGTDKLVSQFLNLLAMKGRLNLLPEVRLEFRTVRLRAEGGIPGALASAEPMSQSDVEALANAFSKKFGKKVVFSVSVDPSLLAGVKVTVNGVTYDGTLRSQLQQLRDKVLVGATG